MQHGDHGTKTAPRSSAFLNDGFRFVIQSIVWRDKMSKVAGAYAIGFASDERRQACWA